MPDRTVSHDGIPGVAQACPPSARRSDGPVPSVQTTVRGPDELAFDSQKERAAERLRV